MKLLEMVTILLCLYWWKQMTQICLFHSTMLGSLHFLWLLIRRQVKLWKLSYQSQTPLLFSIKVQTARQFSTWPFWELIWVRFFFHLFLPFLGFDPLGNSNIKTTADPSLVGFIQRFHLYHLTTIPQFFVKIFSLSLVFLISNLKYFTTIPQYFKTKYFKIFLTSHKFLIFSLYLFNTCLLFVS